MADGATASTNIRLVSGDAGAAVAAFLGALGAGMTFAQLQGRLAGTLVWVDAFWLGADRAWPRLLPTVAVAVLVLVAWLAHRWGWLVAVGGLAVDLAAYESRLVDSLGVSGYLTLLATCGAAVVGGALAAFGVADRLSRLAVGAGLALGMFGGFLALTVAGVHAAAAPRVSLLVPLGLCTVAALVWLLRGVGRAHPAPASVESPPGAGLSESPPEPGSWGPTPASESAGSALTSGSAGSALTSGPAGSATGPATPDRRPGRRSWATPVTTIGIAMAVTALYLGLWAILDSLARAGSSRRRFEAIETLYQIGLFSIGAVAAAVLAIYAYRRGGSILARWVLVGAAAGIAYPMTAGAFGQPGLFGPSGPEAWLAIAAAVAGAVVGAAVSRFSSVPWDGLALAALVLALLFRTPPARTAFADLEPFLRFVVAFAIGFALAVALTALATQTALRGIGGPGEVATLVGQGFVASMLATVVLFPATLLGMGRGSLGLGPILTIALVAVGVFGLYGLGRAAWALRRAIEAEARREAT
jgi:hypothetical protein